MLLDSQIQSIINEIVEKTGVTYEQIKATKYRNANIIAKRALCYHLRVRLDLTMREIASIVGHTDHHAALFHIKRAEEIVDTYGDDDCEARLLREAEAQRLQPDFRRAIRRPRINCESPYSYSICKNK